jgi:hypothetical protein
MLDAKGTADRLPYPELANSIREVALAMNSGGMQAPLRPTPFGFGLRRCPAGKVQEH